MELMFGSNEALAAALHLVNASTIAVAHDVSSITYIHLMFDRLEVICADGFATESFSPGAPTLPAHGFASARPLLRSWETSMMA